ncbi:MAG: rRNA maturation RNase YbeY, partial [Clostridia bacterium]
MEHAEINFLEIEENEKYEEYIKHIVNECFKEEKLDKKNLYINIVLTNPKNIRQINKEQRGIDKETDVLSFPMFEKTEISKIKDNQLDIFGDIVISIERVRNQAEEYGHSFERELAYMVVHGFYHLMGYDHMEEQDKVKMREREENIL